MPYSHSLDSPKLQLATALPHLRTNLTLVLKHLNEIGYHTSAHKLRASDFGVPQRRTRFYIVATRRNAKLFADSPENIHSKVAARLELLKCPCRGPVRSPVVLRPTFASGLQIYKLIIKSQSLGQSLPATCFLFCVQLAAIAFVYP